MDETQRDHAGALARHRLPLAVVGAACIAVGILIAVLVPDSEGPAWAMAVSGSLAAGVLLLARVVFALLRANRRATL